MSARTSPNVLKGASPNVCPLRAQLVDELLGLTPPREKKVKTPEPGSVRKCRKAEPRHCSENRKFAQVGSKSRYLMWANV